jgi:replicative DNA helicase
MFRDLTNIDQEEKLIGSILLNPKALDRLGKLSADTFCDSELGRLFVTLRERHENNLPINDMGLLVPVIRQAGIKIDTARLATLFTEAHGHHAVFYGDNVAEVNRLRNLQRVASTVNQAIEDRTRSSRSILDELEAFIDVQRKDNSSGVETIGQVGTRLVQELEQPTANSVRACWGIRSIDESFGVMLGGEMFVLAARPGCGKTSLAMQTAIANARLGRGVLFVSLEMRSDELTARYLAGASGIDGRDLRERRLTERQKSALKNEVQSIGDYPLHLIAPSTATLGDIRATARSIDDLGLVVIDYLSLLKHRDSRKDYYQQVADNSRSIKRLAKELNVPFLVCQQLNRDADGNRPKLSNLRDSGSVEQDADFVGLLHPVEDGSIEFIAAKNRHGRTGKIVLRFNGERTTFTDQKFSGFEGYAQDGD